MRLGEHLLITHRGSMLSSIGEADLVKTGITKNDRSTPLASTELEVHRSIYKKTSAMAIVHAHPPYAVVLSFTENEIIPCDIEGRAVVPRVPVLGKQAPVKPGDLAEEISEALKQYKVVLVQGHGSFAIGQLLEEAHYSTSILEQSCRLLYLLKSLKLEPDTRIPRLSNEL